MTAMLFTHEILPRFCLLNLLKQMSPCRSSYQYDYSTLDNDATNLKTRENAKLYFLYATIKMLYENSEREGSGMAYVLAKNLRASAEPQ